MTTTQSTEARRTELFARTTAESLLGALVIMDAATKLEEHERMVYAWTCDEIERRHPEVSAKLDAIFDGTDEITETYGQLLTAALNV